MSEENKPAKPGAIVSPEHRAKCMEWALRVVTDGIPAHVVDAAKAFHAYVYEDQS